MLSNEIKESLVEKIAHADHPQELVVDVMLALQDHYGFLSDEAVEEVAGLVGMTPLQVEEWMELNPYKITSAKNWISLWAPPQRMACLRCCRCVALAIVINLPPC